MTTLSIEVYGAKFDSHSPSTCISAPYTVRGKKQCKNHDDYFEPSIMGVIPTVADLQAATKKSRSHLKESDMM